jgi:UDP-N-acetylmuramyl pentapeptide phosphotransferase/UDP-N-acetylglucosamine-1-phosphate transferase
MLPLEPIAKYPVVFLTGMVVSLVVTRFWGPRAPRWGFVDRPGGRKLHQNPTPTAGGIALFLGVHAAFLMVFLYPWRPFAGQLTIDWWFRYAPLSGAVVLLGMVDDRISLKPMVKLLGQIGIAVAAYWMQIRFQHMMGRSLPGPVDLVLTVGWFLVWMNAFNLIDGIDGLATGIALIAGSGMAVSLLFRESPGDVLLLLGFVGACAGFLRYNFHPARIFLGDTGSLFLGFSLATLALTTHSKGPAVAVIGMPLLAVGVPLFDTVLAIWRRSVRHMLRNGSSAKAWASVKTADAEHLHHRLLGDGRKHNQVAWLLYGATFLLTATGVFLSLFHDQVIGTLALGFVAATYIVFRHLAWVELEDSGAVILRGISRPERRNRTLLIYIGLDLLALLFGWLVSVLLLDLQDGVLDVSLKRLWLRSAPLDIVVPFLVLVAFRSYSRVWYLAHVAEYASTGLAVLLGMALACGLRLLFVLGGWTGAWPVVLHYFVMGGVAMPVIVGNRAALRVVQDLMQLVGAHRRDERERVVIWGASYRTALFLRQHAYAQTDSHRLRVVGIFDADTALRGHYLHGVRVAGTLKDIVPFIRNHDIATLYILEEWPEALMPVTSLHADTGVRIRRWRIVEDALHG